MEGVSDFLSGGGMRGDRSALVLVHVNIFAYALCFWIQQPVLPFLSEELGANAVEFGTLSSATSVMALFGGAAMGRLTDVRGAKVTLVLSHMGSLVMYGLMGMATSYYMLLASRLPAIFQHAMLCAQAALSELVLEDKRAVAMGRLSISYGLGMLIGSTFGGYLAKFIGYRGAALFAAALTALVIILDVLFLPNFTAGSSDSTKKKSDGDAKAATPQGGFFGQARAFLAVLTQQKVAHLLMFTFPVSMGIGSFRSMIALAGPTLFGMESSDLGVFISFAAAIGLVTNVFVIGITNKRLGDYYTMLSSTLLQAVCYVGYAHISSYKELVALTVPSTIASTLLYTLANSQMSLAVDATNTATAISISHGSRSLVGTLSPLVGGWVYETQGFYGVCLFAALGCAASAAMALTFAKTSLLSLESSKAALNNKKKN